MQIINSPIAKISRTTIYTVVPRPRVFALLENRPDHSILWLSAPAGSGKTTLVTSWLEERNLPCLWYQLDEGDTDPATFFYYLNHAARKAAPRIRTALPLLTPEYLPGLATFARRYFESLYRRLKPPFTLVFDDYQEVPLGSAFHEIMQIGLSALPEAIRVVVISRSEPPPVFARLRASNRMCLIGWDEIKFDGEETNSLIMQKRPLALPDEVVKELNHWTEGWAAGIVLMLERQKTGTSSAELQHLTREEIFHYFAGELFDKTDRETREFLLASALLPSMTAAEAQQLTDNSRSAVILATLNRNNFFTERHFAEQPVFRYHPLFREFLLSRAEATLAPPQLRELRQKAAVLLEESGRLEPAAELLAKPGTGPGWRG